VHLPADGRPRQLLDVDPEDTPEEDGGNVDLDAARKGKSAVIKTSTRQVRRGVPDLRRCRPPQTHPHLVSAHADVPPATAVLFVCVRVCAPV
jgi:hypothetical protein